VGLYAELDARLAEFGVECRHCGRCCDFSRSDCRLYASFLELALVARRHRRPHLTPSGQCGFLADGRCSIHPLRPLGCRVFFCDPAYKPREQDLCHAFQRRLRALADRYRLPWDYALFLKESG
jgi:Fe-S-cluster containining protein